MKKFTKAHFKNYLKNIKGHLIVSSSEKVIGILNGVDSEFATYGVKYGYLTTEDDGKYTNYQLTEKGLKLAQLVGDTACVSGRTA